MILRILKSITLAVLLFFCLPYLLVGRPRLICIQWQIGQRLDAIRGCILGCLQALLSVAVIVSFWKIGERNSSGGDRVFKPQHGTLIVYPILPILIMALPDIDPLNRVNFDTFVSMGYSAMAWFGMTTFVVFLLMAVRFWRNKDKKSVYGLQHGRLHLDTQVPMWMNMGYWKVDDSTSSAPKSMAEACRDLLELVLSEAGLLANTQKHPSRCLIDVGFGCGEQTLYLMCSNDIKHCDEPSWDVQDRQFDFDHYVGITQDDSQYRYAEERVKAWKSQTTLGPNIRLFCADAAKPQRWGRDVLDSISASQSAAQDTWLLALDTAYHFSPSRWVLIEYAHQKLEASYMAFDLCLSPNATILQKMLLRALTATMGAPWANFVTPEVYRRSLIDIGYSEGSIDIIDISEHVFAPLAEYMDEQGRRLKLLGLGLGSFQAAKLLFRWWGSTGVVRGVVVVAKHERAFRGR